MLVGTGLLMVMDLLLFHRHITAYHVKSARCSELAAEFNVVDIFFSGNFLLGTAFTNHRVFRTDLIMGLNVFEMKRLLAVFTIQGPFRAFSLIVPLKFIGSQKLFA